MEQSSKRVRAGEEGSSTSKTKLTILDLPLETQKDVFKHVSRKNLLRCQLVNAHFHSLASAQLYSVLMFTLTHLDAPNYYTKPDTRLADALHTFATSEHDYGQYVKVFQLQLSDRDTEEIQKKVLSKYHFEEDASRLLNTALVLMLRKAKTLEAFMWDTSIELTSDVYRALTDIQSLHELHIRLDTFPIFRTASFSVTLPNSSQLPSISHGLFHTHASTPGFSATHAPAAPSSLTRIMKGKEMNLLMLPKARRLFSGFKTLRRLDIVGIDGLGCLPEFAQCVQACSATLKALSLSLSNDLTRRARVSPIPEPPTNIATDSDPDATEDEGPPISQQPSIVGSVTLPISVVKADNRVEKTEQDAFLAKILSIEPITAAASKTIDKHLDAAAAKLKSKDDIHQNFMNSLKSFMTKVVQTKPAGYTDLLKDESLLELLEKATKKYLQQNKKNLKISKKSNTQAASILHEDDYGTSSLQPKSHSQHSSSGHPPQYPSYLYDFIMSGGDPYEIIPTSNLAAAPSIPPPQGSGLPHISYKIGPGHPHYEDFLPGASTWAGSDQTGFIHISDVKSPVYQQTYAQYLASMGLPFSSLSSGQPPHVYENAVELAKAELKVAFDAEMKKIVQAELKFQNYVDNQAKQKMELTTTNGVEDDSDTGDSEAENDVVVEILPSNSPPFFPAVESSREDREDTMDIDMEYPDIIDGDDDGEDQVIVDEVENPKGANHKNTKGKTAQPTHAEAEPTASAYPADGACEELESKWGPNTSSHTNKVEIGKREVNSKAASAEAMMHDYLRSTHGLHLEELSLYLVPTKASVLGKALDLTHLRRITLLNVGPQGGFWTLIGRIQKESLPISFESIHTDDVTLAFLSCLEYFSGLKELFMMKRSKKEADSATSKTHASHEDIRMLALRKHVTTLKRLVIMNNEDESWDADSKCLRLLAAKGAALEELAISLSLKDYHILMQNLPGLKSLIALNILAVRADDQCASVVRECCKFTTDTVSHCPNLKLKFLAMAGKVYEMARKPKTLTARKAWKGKGKGKANPADPTWDESEGFSDIENGGLEVAVVKHLKFCDLNLKIFSKEIRTGRL